MSTMYDNLLELPFFQGLCHEDLTSILEKVTLNFHQFEKGNIVSKKGEIANKLIFIMEGRLLKKSKSLNGKMVMEEIIRSPYVIEPQALFGWNTTFFSHYTAQTQLKTLIISKDALRTELLSYEIFKLNFLNYICYYNQLFNQQRWELDKQNLEERLISIFWNLSDRNCIQQLIRVKMTDLADIIDSTRLNVSKILNNWKDKKLIELSRQEILIPHPKKLLMYKDQLKNKKRD